MCSCQPGWRGAYQDHLGCTCLKLTAQLPPQTYKTGISNALALNWAPGPLAIAMWSIGLQAQSQEPNDPGRSPDSALYELCSLEQIIEPL